MNAEQIAVVAGRFQVSDVRVQYQPVNDAMRVGTVVEHIAGEFRVAWDVSDVSGDETWTTLGEGWAFATPGVLELGSTWPVDNHAERMLDGGCATFGRTDDGYDDPAGYA